MPTRSSAAVFLSLVALFPLAQAQNTPDPWSVSQTVKPGDLL